MTRWERAPDGDTCDAAEDRSLGRPMRYCARTGPDRCGAPATLILRSRCGCGACDMTVRLCDEHHTRGWWARDAPVVTS